jgi:glycosyltransferase involved in cell wall biosynthesis
MPKVSVAIVTTFYPPELGGAEAAAERLATFLVRRGHPVLVVTKRTSLNHPAEETLAGVRVIRTGPHGERRASSKWLALPWILREVTRRRGEFQIICCVDYRGVGLAALLAGRLARVPVLFQAQTEGVLSGAGLSERMRPLGVRPGSAAEHVITWPVRFLYGHADAFACISRAIEQEALACGVPRDAVYYIPNPIDTARFAPTTVADRLARRAALGVPAEALVAVFVGRLSREKGVMELVRAWQAAAVKNALLVIVGPDMTGNPWDVGTEARRLVVDQSLAHLVRFAGGQSTREVASWLQIADIAVQPSHFESFGISSVEAMATGLPLVTSDTGGSRDFAETEINALVVPPQDTGALTTALRRLLTDRELRRRLGAAALVTAQLFDERIVLGRLAQVIDRLAAPGPSTEMGHLPAKR